MGYRTDCRMQVVGDPTVFTRTARVVEMARQELGLNTMEVTPDVYQKYLHLRAAEFNMDEAADENGGLEAFFDHGELIPYRVVTSILQRKPDIYPLVNRHLEVTPASH